FFLSHSSPTSVIYTLSLHDALPICCFGYVYLVIRMNPEMANISLPDVPQNFLYLMGVSSAGYLGGKLVRKPGPVIKVLSVAKMRSEEHTSELQSRGHLVCRLLLEKK